MKTFKKSTIKKIEEIKRLFQRGLSFSEIARRAKIDRSCVYYWVSKNFAKEVKILKEKKILQEKLKEMEKIKQAEEKELLRIRDAVIKKAEKEKKRLLKEKLKHACKSCGKEKRGKFELTNFCSRDCWDSCYKPPVNLYGSLPRKVD